MGSSNMNILWIWIYLQLSWPHMVLLWNAKLCLRPHRLHLGLGRVNHMVTVSKH